MNIFQAVINNNYQQIDEILKYNPECLSEKPKEQIILDNGVNDIYINNSPLHFAAEQGNFQMCQFLIERGANINDINVYGCNPAFSALNGYTDDDNFPCKTHLDIVQYFITLPQFNILHRSYNELDLIGELIRKIQHSIVDIDNSIKTGMIVKKELVSLKDVRLLIHNLINRGLDPNTLQGKNGDNALTLAAFHGKLFLYPLLLSYGLNYTHKNNFNQDFWLGITFKDSISILEKQGIFNECIAIIEKMNKKWGEYEIPTHFNSDFLGNPI